MSDTKTSFDTTETGEIYNKSAEVYSKLRSIEDQFNNNFQLEMIKSIIEPPASILDLGSGEGYVARWFCDRGYNYVGIEQSAEMLRIARQTTPTVTKFIWGDMAGEAFSKAKAHGPFQIVVSFYALFHLPVDAQRALFSQVYEAMSRHGLFYFTIMSADLIKAQFPDQENPDRFSGRLCFEGTKYPVARVPNDEYHSILASVGFESISIEDVTTHGRGESETMPWILCRKP
jgi:cyclopropane fatty-acyl-phospholipid synthase-like methyltransferase